MASRCRALSRPAMNLVKSTMNKQSSIPTSSFHIPRSFPVFSRPLPQMGCLQSLLPLHTAVSSARLTSCLGIDSKGSRSLSQGLCCSDSPKTLPHPCRILQKCNSFGGSDTYPST